MNSKLTFKFIANASGVFTGKNGTKVLCDPWIVDGVFEGSWFHYPKLQTKVRDLMDVDAVYVSHLHPDHFDERYFDFPTSMPLIVLDHGPNFLIRKLTALGYTNLIKIKDGETVVFREFEITMFSPFAKHNFHDAIVGNLIDSALLLRCDGISALNANDNTLTIEAAERLARDYGPISLAMLNYNAAGPYPSCFDNLTVGEKVSESVRILERNFSHIKGILAAMKPAYVLPFAGAYVLGGDLHQKNEYLGTTTWDECAAWLNQNHIEPTKVVLLRENDTLDIESGLPDKPYRSIDVSAMRAYIKDHIAAIKYPYQLEQMPDRSELFADMEKASIAMRERMARFGIKSTFTVVFDVFGEKHSIYPDFRKLARDENLSEQLECRVDERLLRNILDRKAHWNNAEVGAHITFVRNPNRYEPDLHTSLQFFHI
ncbi:hypothetical protein B0G84_2312 [Paraburkholderia sp. BL8N3]|nr:hypothetical protein [Paraburkholderia sp. BL8N3]TCK43964.1 hypothetical protein B0G84_2312 [Paraburkholderia sp. BL8N3]